NSLRIVSIVSLRVVNRCKLRRVSRDIFPVLPLQRSTNPASAARARSPSFFGQSIMHSIKRISYRKSKADPFSSLRGNGSHGKVGIGYSRLCDFIFRGSTAALGLLLIAAVKALPI